MTRKQIEGLKMWFEIMVKNYHDKPGELSEKMKELDELLKLMYETYLIKEWKDIEKIRQEVISAGMEQLKRIKEKETA